MIIPIATGGALGFIGLVGMFIGLGIGVLALKWYHDDRMAVRAEMRAGMARLEVLVGEAKAMLPQTPEQWAALEARAAPIVDRLVLHAADQVLQRVGPVLDERVGAYTKELGGMVSGTLGLLLEAKQQGIQYERIDDAREKGLKTRKLQGFTNAAARELAKELDPTQGVVSGRLLDLAEQYGIDPQEALQMGMGILDKYPQIAEKLGPALGKAGHAIKEKVSGTVGTGGTGGGGWG